MESNISLKSRKRTRSKSDELNGTFTRSKSQIYLHRHRSGYARVERKFVESSKSKGSLIIKNDELEEARVSVKDLRARRVFSPTTIATVDDDVSKGDEFGIDDISEGGDAVVDDVIKSGELVGSDIINVTIDVIRGGEVLSNDVSRGSAAVSDDVSNLDELDVIRNVNDDVMEGGEVETDDVMKGDEVVEKCSMVSVENEVGDTKGCLSKSQSPVMSLRARRKVFKSPSSFSYRRLLPYLKDLGNDDSSNFEIVETIYPEQVQKLGNKASNMVKNHEIGGVSVYSRVTDDTFNIASAERYVNKVNPELVKTVEGSVLVQKSLEDVQNDTVEECEQMTPPDSDIYNKPKIDEILGVLVKPTSKRVLKQCSRMNLHTPTSFSHRRLLPFLMSVAEDGLCTLKGNQSSKSEKPRELNQQPPTLSLSHQNVSIDESKTNSNSAQPTTANEKSDSPTSTLAPFDTTLMTVTLKGNQSSIVEKDREQNQQPSTLSLLHKNVRMDQSKTISTCGQSDTANDNSDSPTSRLIPVKTPFERMKTVTQVSNDDLLDAHGTDMGCSESTSQLGVNLQAEGVEFDSSIEVEQSPPKSNLSYVEEATPKAIETSPDICTEQSIDGNKDFTGFKNSYSVDNLTTVNESAQQSVLQIAPLNAPGINGEHFRNGILKRTPRGCRGICNCLNCTSFRLHAERSFEFSRNQMHDAEEVALELINDLTSLRNILERTASDSSSLATDKEKQIKEACEQALHKEEVARARLTQMNEYLGIHCRSMNLSRPKVTFANKIEEKLISKNVYGNKSV